MVRVKGLVKTLIINTLAYLLNSFRDTGCPSRFLQTLIFKVEMRAPKDHNSNEIFVMDAEKCAVPMIKIALLLWYFSTVIHL